LLREALPRLSRVGVLLDASSPESAAFSLNEYEAAARVLKITIQPLYVRGPNPDFDGAFQAAAKERVNALITIRDALTASNPKRIADLAIKHRLPSMHAIVRT
jgi:putative ABC transport system substrate-binding protein